MKKLNTFLVGAIFSAIIFSGTTIFANSNTIPSIASWVKYSFNGQKKTLPEGYSTLVYGGHTYVPARFVAEELGANVVWDEKSKTVQFEKNETTVENNQDSEQENDQTETKMKYDVLPVSKLLDGVNVEVYALEQHDDYSKVFLRIKNTNEQSYQFDQESTQLNVNNTVLTNLDVDDRFPFKKDKSWYRDITEDMTQEGYVMLPELDEDVNQGVLTFKVIKNDSTQEETKFTFNIKW